MIPSPELPFPLDPSFHLENIKQIGARVCVCESVCVVRHPDPDCKGPLRAAFCAWAFGVPSLSHRALRWAAAAQWHGTGLSVLALTDAATCSRVPMTFHVSVCFGVDFQKWGCSSKGRCAYASAGCCQIPLQRLVHLWGPCSHSLAHKV